MQRFKADLQTFDDNNNKITDIKFCSALEEFNKLNRKLFDISYIDRFLSFSDKSNICFLNKSFKGKDFLYYIISKICIDHHTVITDKDNDMENKRTILIDAGNGNNLGHIHFNVVKQSINNNLNPSKILDKIIISRAFTFPQLANIIINEIPQITGKTSHDIQIIVVDILDTLLFSSSSSTPSSSNRIKENIQNKSLKLRDTFYHNEKFLNEMIDILINLSIKYFVMLSYDDYNNAIGDYIISKFNNIVEINQFYDSVKSNENKIKKKTKLIIHNNNSINNPIESTQLISFEETAGLSIKMTVNESVI